MNVEDGQWYWCWPTEHSTPEVVLILGNEEPFWVKLLNGQTMLVVDVHRWGLRVPEPNTLRDVPVSLLERVRDTAHAVGYAATSVAIAATSSIVRAATRRLFRPPESHEGQLPPEIANFWRPKTIEVVDDDTSWQDSPVGRLRVGIDAIKVALEMARIEVPGGMVQLGCIASSADGSGRITARFEADPFIADIEAMLREAPCP